MPDIFAEKYRWLPPIAFVALTIASFVLIYATSVPVAGVVLAVVTLVLYLLFVIFARPAQIPVTIASFAFAVGPMLATLYVAWRSDALYKIAHGGGDVLIQLSFFFSGFLILVVTGVSMYLREPRTRMDKIEGVIILLLIACLCVWALLTSGDLTRIESATVALFGPVMAPPLTTLTYFRGIFLLLSIYLATRPPSGKLPALSPTSAVSETATPQ